MLTALIISSYVRHVLTCKRCCCSYDFIFTAEEVRAARSAGAVVISLSTSHEPGNPPVLDGLQLYARPVAQALAEGAIEPVKQSALISSGASGSVLDVMAGGIGGGGVQGGETTDASDEAHEAVQVQEALQRCSEALALLPPPVATNTSTDAGSGSVHLREECAAGALALLEATCLLEDGVVPWSKVREASRLLLAMLQPGAAAAKLDTAHLDAVSD